MIWWNLRSCHEGERDNRVAAAQLISARLVIVYYWRRKINRLIGSRLEIIDSHSYPTSIGSRRTKSDASGLFRATRGSLSIRPYTKLFMTCPSLKVNLFPMAVLNPSDSCRLGIFRSSAITVGYEYDWRACFQQRHSFRCSKAKTFYIIGWQDIALKSLGICKRPRTKNDRSPAFSHMHSVGCASHWKICIVEARWVKENTEKAKINYVFACGRGSG